jgi:hypothetical protein
MKWPRAKIGFLAAWILGAIGLVSSLAASDVGAYYVVGKEEYYYQTSNVTPPALDVDNAYGFTTMIDAGTSGMLLTSSSLTPPGGSTGTVTYTQSGSGNLKFGEQFQTKSLLDSAFKNGTYEMTIQTSTPNTYMVPITLGSDDYPTTIPTITNTFSSGDIVIDPSQPYTFTWNGFTGLLVQFQIQGTSVDYQATQTNGTQTSDMIAASTLAPDETYTASLEFALNSGSFDTSSIPGSTGIGFFGDVTNFTITTTPEPGPASLLVLGGVVLMFVAVRRKARSS